MRAVMFGRHQGKRVAGPIDDHMKRCVPSSYLFLGKAEVRRHRIRHAHSPESWAAMWRSVFTELKGETWAAEHIEVSGYVEELKGLGLEKFFQEQGEEAPKERKQTLMLWWSVKIFD